MQDDIRLSVFAEKKDKQLVYLPEKCIGCGPVCRHALKVT